MALGWLLRFTIYRFATFFPSSPPLPLARCLLLFLFSFSAAPFARLSVRLPTGQEPVDSLESPATRCPKRESKGEGEPIDEGERARDAKSRRSREVKPLLPKRIMRGKIKFFSTRPFQLHRPRDRALPLLALYIVYIFTFYRARSTPARHCP